MTIIVDGKKIARAILDDLTGRVKTLKEKGATPALAVVLVGDDKPSHTYVDKKQKAAERIGVKFFRHALPADITKTALIKEIKRMQKERRLSGLIVQLPLPGPLQPDAREIVDVIDANLDVDCLSYCALGKVLMGANPLVPPTPGAVMEILRYHQVELAGKHVCLVGRGELIGRPLAAMLTHEPVALSVHGRATKNLAVFTKTADVIITGVGRAGIVTGEMIKAGAVVIDAGVTFVNGIMAGDVVYNEAVKKAGLITPVPGGVGPVTVAKLLENTVISAERA